MRQKIRSRRPIKAPTGTFPPNKSAGLSARSCDNRRWQNCYIVSFPALSIASAALIASAVLVGAESQARTASNYSFEAGGLGKCKYLWNIEHWARSAPETRNNELPGSLSTSVAQGSANHPWTRLNFSELISNASPLVYIPLLHTNNTGISI